MSPDGRSTASRVKTKRIASLDIAGYAERVLTVAVDGNPWETKFLSIWGISFSPDGSSAAAGVKLKPMEFTIAVDGVLWQETFLCVWEPVFKMQTGEVVAPVKTGRGWTLAINGQPMWDRYFSQVWGQRYSPDGKKDSSRCSSRIWQMDDNALTVLHGKRHSEMRFSPLHSALTAKGLPQS